MSRSPAAEYQAPFRLPMPEINGFGRATMRLARPFLEQLLALPDLNRLHARINGLNPIDSFPERALCAMNVRMCVHGDELARIPVNGPLVVVANHPFGGLDGVALLALLRRRRPDVRIMANHLLNMVPEMRELSLFVDPFGGSGSTVRNLAGVRAALRWVRGGGCLAIFPAGEVSSLDIRRRSVVDGEWNTNVASLVRATGAAVLPVFFAGRNSKACR